MAAPAQNRDPARRDKILAAALDCFAERGFGATTIDDIRSASGASTGSIYHHFGGKEQIAAALYVEGLGEYQAGVLRALSTSGDAEGAVKAIVRNHLRWVQSNRKLAAFLLTRREPEVKLASQAPLRELNRELFAQVDAWLARHIDRGEIQPMSRDAFYAVVIGPAQEVSRHWLAGRTNTGIATLEKELGQAAWKAIRKEKK